MAKKTIIPQAVNLINEICDLVRTYVIDNKSKRNFWQYDFCKETGISSNIYGHLNGNKQGGMNLNSACLLLDAIGYELKIVKKEDKKIVQWTIFPTRLGDSPHLHQKSRNLNRDYHLFIL